MAKPTTRTSSVLGPNGKPVSVSVLTSDQTAPTVTGVRSPWSEAITSGLTPAKLTQLLKAANEGDNREYLVLAEEMEERDGHYGSVLGQRKRAVSGIEPTVTPASKEEIDKEIAEEVTKLVRKPIFADMVDDLLDGIAKGYSVCKIEWLYGSDRWEPQSYIHRDPRHFQFDKETGSELRIRQDGNEDGIAIDPYTVIVHRPKLKTGLTMRGGIARIAMWCFMLKTYTLQDWAAFLEVFGMPLRLGKYDDAASPEEKRVLLRAVRDLGHAAAAIIPKGMEIELTEVSGGQGNAVFGAMTEYLDKQMSKAIIGQTMTTDDGSSHSQSETHDEVRGDIKRADARQMGSTITRDLVAPFVAFNWGPDAEVPEVSFPVEDPEDIKVMSEAIDKLVPYGLRIAVSDVNRKMGYRVPDDDEAVLVAPTPAAASTPPAARETATLRHACPSCGERHLANAQDDPDPLVSEALGDWEADMGPTVAAILAAAKTSTGYDELLSNLDQITPDVAAMADRLAIQMMKARGDGDLGG